MTDREKTRKKSAYETSSDHLAERLFAEDEMSALSGSKIISAEGHSADVWDASPNRKKSKMARALAEGQPERFLELVGYLPHVIQDIFYQYFLLGRTQEQIGYTLDLRQKQVWQALELGVDCVAVIALYDGPPPGDASEDVLATYGRMLSFRTDPGQRESLEFAEPTTLGEFILSTSDKDIEKSFAPQTPDGPAI
jgi:hypothetical protein